MAPNPLSAVELRNFLERDFPNWRSLEVFGPPGAGKSYFARRASEQLYVLTMCDRQAVRFYAAQDNPRIAQVAERLLAGRTLKNFYSIWLQIASRRYWAAAPPQAQRYSTALNQVLKAFPLFPAEAARRFVNRVGGSGAITDRAVRDARQIIVDEGVLNQLSALIARSTNDVAGTAYLDLVRNCLVEYPWEKNALLLEASAATCEARQISRGHILFTKKVPQSVFHDTVETIARLCEDTGWTVRRLNSDDPELTLPG